MKAWLVLSVGREIEVGSHCQIGRAPGAAVRIDSGQVSRQHALIHLQDAGLEPEWWIADLGSTNGTIRNGRRVTIPCRLSDGDTIVVGEARLTWRQAAPPDLLGRPPHARESPAITNCLA